MLEQSHVHTKTEAGTHSPVFKHIISTKKNAISNLSQSSNKCD